MTFFEKPRNLYDHTLVLELWMRENGRPPSALFVSESYKQSELKDLFTAENFKLEYTSRVFGSTGNRQTHSRLEIYSTRYSSLLLRVIVSKNGEEEYSDLSVFFKEEESNLANELCEKVDKCTKYKEKSTKKINLVVQEGMNLTLNSFPLKDYKVDIDTNYNDDFKPISDLILNKLDNSDKGVVLLHGTPGTGKTNYIRYLCSNLKKRTIYLPPNLANEIASPSFLNFLTAYPNSILIIEDAENIIRKRDGYGSISAVSNLLNVSDGLLSDILNIQIVATFNCKITDIDEALLRKGRIIAEYEFGKLKAEKAKMLSEKLGFRSNINSAMTLAEIYGQDDLAFKKEREALGFKIA